MKRKPCPLCEGTGILESTEYMQPEPSSLNSGTGMFLFSRRSFLNHSLPYYKTTRQVCSFCNGHGVHPEGENDQT